MKKDWLSDKMVEDLARVGIQMDIVQAYEEMQIPVLERYQRMLDISRDLASTLNLDTLLERIVHAAADLSDSQAASILLYDQVKNQLHFEATTNLDEPVQRGIEVPVDSSVAGWIVINRVPIIVADVKDDPRHCGNVAKKTNVQTHSLLGVPLITKDKVIGVLEAINKREGVFDLEDQNILTILGAQAAVAIENARLFQQSDMLSELMHEFRAPLSMMQTAAQLFLRPELSSEERNHVAEIILQETRRLSDMTASYLDLARMESGRIQFHWQQVDLRTLLPECVALMSNKVQEKGLELSVSLPKELATVGADPERLKQVMINLISNAIKYTPAPGRIDISVYETCDHMVLEVQDTGIGIPAASLQHLFQKFYRIPESEKMAHGSGLGLSICKRIIDAHGGQIEVKSEMGAGTTFKILLPLKKVSTEN
jgi:signal transduction histidine kinase